MDNDIYDVIIIGGSYAGLSAAMQLARARCKVLIIDEGLRRNRFASHSHGFVTQDGVDPAVIAATARQQVLNYPTVQWISGRADSARRIENSGSADLAFEVAVAGTLHLSSRLLLATGVKDVLPEIKGLAERWGKSVFHCPYCHGYELNQGPIGVIAGSELSMHHGLMLPDWGPTTLLINEAFEPDIEQLAALDARRVIVERSPIGELTGHADIKLVDGRTLSFAGIFTLAPFELTSPIAEQLGLEMDRGPLGAIIKTDQLKETSMPGVFACGDVARMMASVALAVGDGNLAGAGVHRSLMFGTH
ncbi:NAD(P)/FAD-dependent oxidoreductase [Agrobacterium sp. rho-13.3]|uniref:NAD(P)/FAD-dependent oxidoreductase n=1 Tax=Agrobacterium sp. rho-13.3 TaxID=3072980 RepID=UPI002A0DBF2C|nr:NAD(P)/FAD-dependent oxidoreductase [Agrobacterium sp. rho-13.3]MDX8306160.1 NAD(P)/FAD-dependent oxidoreductase [Agrobacterium sp. rho-13.3]MDX8307509.1 NAD(P)/FAD-dependent oxidoreductase [Agrobacterium sp. rho-13.3]